MNAEITTYTFAGEKDCPPHEFVTARGETENLEEAKKFAKANGLQVIENTYELLESEPQAKMDYRPQKFWLVTWKIDIESPNQMEAAKEALLIQRDSKSVATVFNVIDMDSQAGKSIGHGFQRPGLSDGIEIDLGQTTK